MLRRNRRARDRLEIAELVVNYARAIDDRDWSALRACFIDDVEWKYNQREARRGLDPLEELIVRSVDNCDLTQHFVSNHRAQVSGQTAGAETYFLAQHVRKREGIDAHFLVGGIYRDVLVRHRGNWRISARGLTVNWSMGDRTVLHPEA